MRIILITIASLCFLQGCASKRYCGDICKRPLSNEREITVWWTDDMLTDGKPENIGVYEIYKKYNDAAPVKKRYQDK